MKILRTASLGSKFTGSYKECIPMLPSILEPSQLKASKKFASRNLTKSPHKGNLRLERIRNSRERLFLCVVHADEALGATCTP